MSRRKSPMLELLSILLPLAVLLTACQLFSPANMPAAPPSEQAEPAASATSISPAEKSYV